MHDHKVEWDHYRTAYQVVREFTQRQRGSAYAQFGALMQLVVKTDLKPMDFFEGARTAFLASIGRGMGADRVSIASYRQMMEEYRWYRLGQPRYRVYPAMVAALSRISIDIDAGHLRLPFPTFSVEFPKDYFRENESSPYLKGMLVHCRRRDDATVDRFDYGVRYTTSGKDTVNRGPAPNESSDVMIVDLDFGDEIVTSPTTGERGPNACKPFAIFDIDAGKTIAERFELMPQVPPVDDGYMPSNDFQKACLRIAVGVAFFAVNDHEVIQRFIPQGYVDRRERAARTNNKKTFQKISNEIKNSGFLHTFDVGRELVINELDENDNARPPSDPTGRHLQWGHVRGGHLRWQPYGPREAPTYKLIFVAPTVVRPDLPLRPGAPHAVKE